MNKKRMFLLVTLISAASFALSSKAGAGGSARKIGELPCFGWTMCGAIYRHIDYETGIACYFTDKEHISCAAMSARH